jgi:tripartite-type tricarboxylate transporter receptor subunit TctC
LVDKRNPLAPDVPTLAEAGFDIPHLWYWGGIVGPAGMPKPVVELLQKQIAVALETPTLKARYATLGIVPVFKPADELGRIVEADLRWIGAAIKAANLTFN